MASSDQQTRTTLTGKPFEQKHDTYTNVMLSDGGGFGATNAAGANLLPPGYTDNSLVRIPIKVSDYDELAKKEAPTDKKKGGIFGKLKALTKDKAGGDFEVIGMRRADYLKYWAKGEDGKFLPSVEEPPEGRAEWIEKQLELNAQWKRDGTM